MVAFYDAKTHKKNPDLNSRPLFTNVSRIYKPSLLRVGEEIARPEILYTGSTSPLFLHDFKHSTASVPSNPTPLEVSSSGFSQSKKSRSVPEY